MSNNDQYMGLFLAEMEEQLEMLNQSVLALENSNQDPDILNRLFRVAHTLKGSSATMGFDIISDLTHHMENLLDDVRQGKIAVSLNLIDTIFACLDQLQTWRDILASGSDNLNHANELINRLNQIAKGELLPKETNNVEDTMELCMTQEILELSQQYQQQTTKTTNTPKNTKIIKQQGKQKTDNENTPTPGKSVEGNDYLRIEVGKLDVLMNLLGELVIDRARLGQIETEIENTIGGESADGLGEVTRHISIVTGELQECLLKLRMSPMSMVYGRLPRIVRDISHQLEKEVNLVMEGEETELDRTVIQNIFEPMIHLIRNSLDHGFESIEERLAAGKPAICQLTIKAEQVGGEILITVRDDGKGIDPERIRQKAIERGMITAQEAKIAKDTDVIYWIFDAGFSTSEEVSEISGRGVGMDVVRHKVDEMHGRVQIESVVGAGTLISITLPLTLAVVRALMVDVGGNTYTIPLVNVLETIRVPKKEVHKLGANPAIVVRGRTIPLIDLLEWSDIEDEAQEKKQFISVVLVSTGIRQAGLIVSKFIGELEVVVKPLDKYLGRIEGFAGATLLGDGSVSLIYDIPALVKGVDVFLKGAS